MTVAGLADERALAIDLFCGLGGWTEGLMAEGYDVIGFDITRHVYGEHRYPAQLVLQDVLTLHGRQFKDAALIVASPPCQAYSWRAMPWKAAKAAPPPDNSLFEACFRIQREASEAACHHVPMVVENVKGAQKWVGRARWNYGSYYLWGDVPALMPIVQRRSAMKAGVTHRPDGSTNFHGLKSPGQNWSRYAKTGEVNPHWNMQAIKNSGGSWFNVAHNTTSGKGQNPDGRKGPDGSWLHGNREHPSRKHSSGSKARKFASAQIAKIPLPLARHIAAIYKPRLAT